MPRWNIVYKSKPEADGVVMQQLHTMTTESAMGELLQTVCLENLEHTDFESLSCKLWFQDTSPIRVELPDGASYHLEQRT